MRKLLVPLFLALVSCAPARAPQTGPPPLAATSTARRVVLISFDGIGADLLSQQKLPAFEKLAAAGATARIIPIDPPATAPAHVAIFTGAGPHRNGVISNSFHVRGRPVEEAAVGMKTDIEVETLLDTARRQGKRVGDVTFPTIDGRGARRSADFGMIWTTSLTTGRIIRLTSADFRSEWVPRTWSAPSPRRTSFSPIMRARIEWSAPKRVQTDVDIVAYDTTDDRVKNYDAFLIESGEREIVPDARGWFPISRQTGEGLFGSWSKLLRTDPGLADMQVYWGAIARNEAYPESYRTMIDTEAGFFPSPPDDDAGIDAVTFTEQVDRIADFFTRAQTVTIRRMEFDLLFAYQPQIDEAGHAWLRREGGEPVIRAAYASADRAVAAITAALDLSRDALVITGDHGMLAVDTEVRVNALLAEAGLATRWRAYASGQLVHIYRFGGADDTAAVVAMLKASGHFERVETRNAAWHPNSGDIVATANPNVVLSSSKTSPAAIRAVGGAHGGLNTNRGLHTVLVAAGAGVPAGDFGEVAQTKIARFVSTLLGIAPPAAAE